MSIWIEPKRNKREDMIELEMIWVRETKQIIYSDHLNDKHYSNIYFRVFVWGIFVSSRINNKLSKDWIN